MRKQASHIAWLNSCSVMRGTLAEVTVYALRVFSTPRWQKTEAGRKTQLRITKADRYQTTVSARILTAADIIPGTQDF